MGLEDIKEELEKHLLGHSLSESVFDKCINAYHCARHGPVGLGGYAAMGYIKSFQQAMGDDYEVGMYGFFCGKDEPGERVRKLLIPYQFNLEFMPQVLARAYRETYKSEPYYNFCDWWYERFIWYFLKVGIPEDGVAGIIRKHKIPIELVKKSGATSGLRPETVAQNILNHRHDPVEYDSLAKPKIRVTKKKIADFRKRLAEELRRIWSDPKSLEETIQEECYDASDEDISRMILHSTRPEVWAQNLNEI